MRDAILDILDFARTEAGDSTLVFWSGEVGADRTFELRDWGTGGGSPPSRLTRHCLGRIDSIKLGRGNYRNTWVN